MGGIADGEIERYDPLPPELVGRLVLGSHPRWTKSARPPDPRVGQGEGGTVGCVDGRSGDLMLSPAHPRVTLRERSRRTVGWAGDRRKIGEFKIWDFGEFWDFKFGEFKDQAARLSHRHGFFYSPSKRFYVGSPGA